MIEGRLQIGTYLNRELDKLMNLGPEEFRSVFMTLFSDGSPYGKRVRAEYAYKIHAPHDFQIFTEPAEVINALGSNYLDALVILQLFYFKDEALRRGSREEKKIHMLDSGAQITLPELLPDILTIAENYPMPILIYSINPATRPSNPYELFRTMNEERIIKVVDKQFGNHPQVSIRTNKHMPMIYSEASRILGPMHRSLQ